MTWKIIAGDCLDSLRGLPDESVHCCVTSPPYWGLRDYGVAGQIGLERSPEDFVARLVDVFREVRRVLRSDGTLWLNLGDCYATGSGSARSPGGKAYGKSNAVIDAGSFPVSQPNRMPILGLKPKDLVGIPWRVAFALQSDGWYLRSEIIWHKPNSMPESVSDRPTKAHEQIFLLTRSDRYLYDADAVREPHNPESVARSVRGRSGNSKWANGDGLNSPHTMLHSMEKCCHPNGRNRRTVWTVPTHPYSGAHFATFPPKLIEPCILAGCPRGGTVLDPFAGAGTTGLVALRNSRNFIGIELNPEYIALARRRIIGDSPLLNAQAEAVC